MDSMYGYAREMTTVPSIRPTGTLARVLVIHNRYQHAGGEDVVVRAEVELLRRMGHEVEVFEEDNDSILRWSDSAKAAVQSVYSIASARRMRELIEGFRPAIAHIHNFFPRLSPAVHYACRSAGIPVVQTLHNYRLLCPAAILLRDGEICEDCVGKSVAWPAIWHQCYRQSRVGSAVVVGMLATHRALGTWMKTVGRFIALTEFARTKFIAGGLPAEKIIVRPNFVNQDNGMGTGVGRYALFVGRLSKEKGISTLLEAWKQLNGEVALRIAGDGPLAPEVRDAAANMKGVEWLGHCTQDEVRRLMADASVLVVPSVCYETFGMVIVEALAAGLPSVASRLGAMAELVRDGDTGKLFAAGDSTALAAAVRSVLQDRAMHERMRVASRRDFEQRFTAEAGYLSLMRIYQDVSAPSGSRLLQ